MPYMTAYQYYENGGNQPENANWGSYQYVPLSEIMNNFMLNYVGNHKLINNIDRFTVLFHAKQCIKYLNYDAVKEIKALELTVGDNLLFVLPPDYVNWVRISMEHEGLLHPLTENIQALSSDAYLQDHTAKILFDEDGNVLKPEFSNLDLAQLENTAQSLYINQGHNQNGNYGWYIDGNWYFGYDYGNAYGGFFGMNTETANVLPTFNVDQKAGVIRFSSHMADKLCVLEYVSDGMEGGDNSLIGVNKLFERYVYLYVQSEILSNKFGVQEYVVRRAKKDAENEWRNSRIRMGDFQPGKLLMNLRGQNKWIK